MFIYQTLKKMFYRFQLLAHSFQTRYTVTRGHTLEGSNRTLTMILYSTPLIAGESESWLKRRSNSGELKYAERVTCVVSTKQVSTITSILVYMYIVCLS